MSANTQTRRPSSAALQRRLDAALVRVERLKADARTAKLAARDAWSRDPSQWAAHVEGYEHRRAIECAAAKWGHLGAGFLALLAARLVVVDVDPSDGTAPTPETAARLVAQWSAEGAKSALRREKEA